MTLLYGGLNILAAVEFAKWFDVFGGLGDIGNLGLGVLILAWGTLGLYGARKQFIGAGQWRAALQFAKLLTGGLAVLSTITGSGLLTAACLVLFVVHGIAGLAG